MSSPSSALPKPDCRITSNEVVGKEFAWIEVVPDPLVIADQTNTILHANRLCKTWWPIPQSMPPHLDQWIHPETPPARHSPDTWPDALLVLNTGIGPRWVKVSRKTLSPEQPGYHVFIFQDQTSNQQAEAQATNLTAQLALLESDYRHFLSAVSHDLGEPLEKIHAFGFLLRDEAGEALAPSALQYLELMTEATLRMRSRLDDLVVYSRIHTQRRALYQVNLDRLWHETLETFEPRISVLNANITAATLPTIPADGVLIRLLFHHLVDNALKFHLPDTPPELELRVVLRTQSISDPTYPGLHKEQQVVDLSFCDKGIGFEQSLSDKLFRPFSRLVPKSAYPGNGMGLAICRAVVTRHGGLIGIRSKNGEGTTVKVRLPLEYNEDFCTLV